jgi:hypothetical protein
MIVGSENHHFQHATLANEKEALDTAGYRKSSIPSCVRAEARRRKEGLD